MGTQVHIAGKSKRKRLSSFAASRTAFAIVVGFGACLFWLWSSDSEAQNKNTSAGKVHVATAANFVSIQNSLAKHFTAETGHSVTTSSGSTGKLYAQIHNGAPFDIFLSADTERPKLLEEQGLTAPDGRFTYAQGRLALYSPHTKDGKATLEALKRGDFKHLAMANPITAPYGAATKQVLEKMGLWNQYVKQLVRGENIAQTLHFVQSGGAEIGFVALSQMVHLEFKNYWPIPQDSHILIKQDAVLLKSAADNQAAKAYFQFLRSEAAREMIKMAGYDAGPQM